VDPTVATNKQRREAARRHLERQLERRREAELRRRRATTITSAVLALVLVAVVALVLIVTTGDDTKNTADGVACNYTASTETPAKQVDTPDAAGVVNKGTVTANVVTTQGPLVFTLNRALAPCTVNSFVSLANQKYYDASPCHRANTSSIYILQCGDPSGTGSGGPGYTIPDEYTGTEKYTRGVLAMANTGSANTGGGQFFIVYKDDALPASYTIFGTVTSGMDIIDKVAAAGTDSANGDGDGAPLLPISITSVTITASTTSAPVAPSSAASSTAVSSSPAG
jgi:peptidyl-prolyl cis-trans isomerase B (cyclophilin B)